MFILTLKRLSNCILSDKPWQVFDLSMSVDGFAALNSELKKINQKMPQVYIHVCDQGILKNKVLRIGKAETGIYNRWLSAKDGHKNTFFWAIDKTKKYYGEKNAEGYPNYLLFFALLNDLKTKLYVLSCQDGKDGQFVARSAEQALIGHFSPLWETYRVKFKKFKKKGDRFIFCFSLVVPVHGIQYVYQSFRKPLLQTDYFQLIVPSKIGDRFTFFFIMMSKRGS